MADLAASLGTLGGEAMSGLGSLGGDLASGANSLFSGIGGALGGGGDFLSGILSGKGGTGFSPPGAITNGAIPNIGTELAGENISPGLSVGGFSAGPGDLASGLLGNSASPNITSGLASDMAGMTGAEGSVPGLTGAPGGVPGLTSGGGFLSQLLGGGGGAGGARGLLSTGLLGMDLIKGMQTPKGEKELQKIQKEQQAFATKQQSQAQGNQEGFLGAGGDALVQEQLTADEASIRSKYAQMGMSGSSAEAQDLQAARERSLAMRFKIGEQLAQTGFNNAATATGTSVDLLNTLLQDQMQRDQNFASTLADFAGASVRPAPVGA